MNDLVVYAYIAFAFAGSGILVYVITQAMNDLHLKRTDPPSVAMSRKLTFYADGAFLLLTVYFKDYWLTNPSVISTALVSIGFVGGGIAILMVSLVSMKKRAPPPSGHLYPEARFGRARMFFRQRHEDR